MCVLRLVYGVVFWYTNRMKTSIDCKISRRQAIGGVFAAGLCFGANDLMGEEDAVFTLRPKTTILPSDGKTPIPLLGLGSAERFPLNDRTENKGPDLQRAEGLVDFALKHGIKWIDTGYKYHHGKSEPFLGRVLKNYPRDSFYLSTKLPPWNIKTLDDAKATFEEQLKRCQVEYFDFYLLHSVIKKEDFERVYVKLGVLDYLLEQKKAGRIRHLGLSYHGKSAYLGELLDTYPGTFEVCMLMLNKMEFTWNKDAPKLAETCAKRGVSVLVMEPLAGGRAANLSDAAIKILKKVHPNDSAARWGFRFAASLPGVIAIFSGMDRIAYMKENIETLSDGFKPLTEEEQKTYSEAMAVHMKYPSIPCTGCSYCVPCPYGVRIPEIFKWYNGWSQRGLLPSDDGQNDSQDLRRRFLASYYNTFYASERADRCCGCKKCLVPCPQWTFRIPTEMEKISDLVANTEKTYVKKGGVIR